MKLLVVEDDRRLLGLLDRGLSRAGWTVTRTETALQAQDEVLAGHFDAVVCDVMLPDSSGFELCRWIREQEIWAPILLLTARTGVSDRVEGLNSGADDYLGKPFAFEELDARLRALARRGPVERPTSLTVGRFTLDQARQTVSIDGQRLELTAREFGLLHTFLRHPGQLLTRSELLDRVWESSYDAGSNVVDVYIRYLRRKLAPFGAADCLVTVRGRGYLLEIGEDA